MPATGSTTYLRFIIVTHAHGVQYTRLDGFFKLMQGVLRDKVASSDLQSLFETQVQSYDHTTSFGIHVFSLDLGSNLIKLRHARQNL
ncbi:hypothetical protein VNO77_07068 [Canavalia gladiata]|uniref:Uncharacterized protein n=1 Tax=Canavalia gladiata TaxID=3824 RepID=A0AAN9M849_CANGL